MRKNIFIYGLIALVTMSFAPIKSHATTNKSQCNEIATVYSQTICRKDIALSDTEKDNLAKQAKAIGKKPEDLFLDFEKSNLISTIWDSVLVQKYDKENIKPSAEEIEAYIKTKAEREALQLSYAKEIIALTEKALNEKNYDAEQALKLNQIIMQQQDRLSSVDKKDNKLNSMLDKEIGKQIIGKWKSDKALYDEYKGGVSVNQSGLKPIEAYLAFAKELKANKEIAITDKAFSSIFDDMIAFLSEQKNFIPEEQRAEIDAFFAKPFWLNSKQIAKEEFEYTKKLIANIPEKKKEEKGQ